MLEARTLRELQIFKVIGVCPSDLDVVSNIQTSSSIDNSLTVTFNEADDKKDGYSVRCYPDPSDTPREGVTPKEAVITCKTSQCTCTDLTPGQKYKIEVNTTREGFIPQKAVNDGTGQTGMK